VRSTFALVLLGDLVYVVVAASVVDPLRHATPLMMLFAAFVAAWFSVVVSARAARSTWLAGLRPGDEVDVVGPLGRPFPLPAPGTPALLVGGGYGAAALVGLGGLLRSRGHEVAAVVGAGDEARLCSVDELTEVAAPFVVTTDDGSVGRQGRVTGPVAELVSGAGVVYACGPMPMLEPSPAWRAERNQSATSPRPILLVVDAQGLSTGTSPRSLTTTLGTRL